MTKISKHTIIFSKKRIYIAVLIGLAISGYLLFTEINTSDFKNSLSQINWSFKTFLFLFLAILMMLIRDFGYVLRLRLLTDNKLSWNTWSNNN